MKVSRLRLILLVSWFILAGLIVWFKIVPLGSATYSISYPVKFKLLDGKGFVGQFTPQDRVEIKVGEMAKITGDPVYFSVFTPRTFSQAKITVTYQNNLSTSTPIITAGVLVDNIVWRYKLAPLENSLLSDEFKDWNKLISGDTILLQKNKNFLSVDDFLAALKDKPETLCKDKNLQDCLVLYNTDELEKYFPKTTLPKNIPEFKPINIPLQGTHQFYFIAKKGQALNFDFDLTDLNLNKDSDPVIVSIYKEGVKIYSTTLADTFGDEGTGKVRNFFAPLSYPAFSSTTNLYKLEIKAGDDIVIKKISKAPSALNAISRLRPVTVSSLPLSFWTNSSFIQITTNNPASRQTLVFGNTNYRLDEAYKQFEFAGGKAGLKEVRLTRDDVILENDGIFSFAPDDFFNPEFKQLDRHFVLNNQAEYVLAKYQAPKILDNNLKEATVILNTKEAYREKGKYSFIISVPGLSLENKGNLLIKEVKVEFSGRTVWDKIKEKVLSYVN